VWVGGRTEGTVSGEQIEREIVDQKGCGKLVKPNRRNTLKEIGKLQRARAMASPIRRWAEAYEPEDRRLKAKHRVGHARERAIHVLLHSLEGITATLVKCCIKHLTPNDLDGQTHELRLVPGASGGGGGGGR
jgi:hypothetical protein